MIRYLTNTFIDRQKYDHCVRMDELGLVYAFSWYLDEVCAEWDCLVLNDYDAVWPLPVRRKWGIKYFFRPYAVQQLGVFSKLPLDADKIREFIIAMKVHCRYAEVWLNEGQLTELAQAAELHLQANVNLTLDLNRTFREIYHAYSKHTQRNITRSSKFPLQIFEQDDPERLIELFRANKGEKLTLSEEFYRNMGKAMYHCLHKGIGKVWTVYDERNTLAAGIFMVETDKRHTLLFSASSPEGKEHRAMFHLINEYIIYSCGRDKLLDFEGSNDPGQRRFYEGFGAEVKSYNKLVYNGLPWPLKLFKS